MDGENVESVFGANTPFSNLSSLVWMCPNKPVKIEKERKKKYERAKSITIYFHQRYMTSW